MILDFETYCLNETSLRTAKRTLHGVLGTKDRATMKKLLRKHVISFKFKKKNGDIRRAVGTLISSYLPALRGGAPKPEHQMVYYDLEKEHWRSFRSYSFIKILDIKSEDDYKGIKHKPIHKEVEKDDDEKKEKKEKDEKIEKVDKHEEVEKDVKKKHSPDEHDEHDEHVDKKSDSEHDTEKDDIKKEKDDIKKKEYKPGDKIPEKELMRRSTDFRKGSRKNEFTKKSNDAKKKGELDDEDEGESED